jgi:hypothetical protein
VVDGKSALVARLDDFVTRIARFDVAEAGTARTDEQLAQPWSDLEDRCAARQVAHQG